MNTNQPVARGLFVATILVGSFLLFLVQPMVARMALPRLGGAPNVWNSAMLVYQALLLAGYAYAHRLSQGQVRRQSLIHLGLLLVFVIALPISLYRLPPPAPGWEVLWVPLLLLLTVGPVFFIVSAQAPLMQRWFVSHPAAGEPWALYAASNIGSFAGLVAYPLLAEPLLSLDHQSLTWSLGYGFLVFLVALCAWMRRDMTLVSMSEAGDSAAEEPICWKRMLLWLALSAIPSGLMLSTTTHLTTDIFAMPLLWVIPLGLYLLSFVVAFADNRDLSWALSFMAPPAMLLAGGLTMISRHSGSLTLALASVALLFVVAVTLHGRLYDLKPHSSKLTLFYLMMSLGGALGGAFAAIIAPVAFDWVWEHPALVFAAALLMPLPALFKWHQPEGLEPQSVRFGAALLLAFAAILAWILSDIASRTEPGVARVYLTVTLCGVGLLLIPWRWMFVTVLLMLMLAQGGIRTIEATLDGQRSRSYFGVYTILDYPSRHLRMLVNGTTLHGQQSTDPAKLREPSTYYGPNTGAAIALRQAPALYGPKARIGVVGLGTGTLACMRQPGQRWTFFEIDPVVLQFSRNGTFTYLETCAPHAQVVIGDARLELAKLPPASFDLLVVDAFTSDAIPLHLLTKEAFEVYFRAIAEDGLVVIHISNRYIELEPVVAAVARELDVFAAVRDDNPADRTILTPSTWVVLSRDGKTLNTLAEARPDAPWDPLQAPAKRAWTDEFASILPFIRWRKLLGSL